MKLNPCKSCPLIQLIDFAVISRISPACSLYLWQSVSLSDFSAGSWWQPDGHSEAQQVFRLSTAQDNVHLVHEAKKKNVATQASLIHLAKPKEAVHCICKIHQMEEGVQAVVEQTNQKLRHLCGRVLILLSQWLLPISWGLISHSTVQVNNRKRKVEVLIGLSAIESDVFWMDLGVNLTGFGALFFSSQQPSRLPLCTGVVQEMLIFLAKETRATTFWQLPRLHWLMESDSEHMHTHRRTPTHTVGGDRQLSGGRIYSHTHTHTVWGERHAHKHE